MKTEVAQAINNKYEAAIELKKLLKGGLWFYQAPEYAEDPYGVYTFLGLTEEQWMGSKNKMEMAAFQFMLFSADMAGAETLTQITKVLTDVYDWAQLSIDDYYIVKMQRNNIGPIVYTDEIWQINIDYDVWYVKE